MPSKQVLAIVIGLSLSTVATAEEYRQHSAHVHGHVEFNIAQDGSDLLLEITAPGADVIGFEHAPENAEQEKTLQHAVATLEDSNALFAINPQAQCEIEEVHVEHSLGGNMKNMSTMIMKVMKVMKVTTMMNTPITITTNMITTVMKVTTIQSTATTVNLPCNIAFIVPKSANLAVFKLIGLTNSQVLNR